MNEPQIEPRRMHARVVEVPDATPADGEVAVYLVSLVDRTFDGAIGIASASAADRGVPLHAAGPSGLSVGDLVTIDRRGNRWWMTEEFAAGFVDPPRLLVTYETADGTEWLVDVLGESGRLLRTHRLFTTGTSRPLSWRGGAIGPDGGYAVFYSLGDGVDESVVTGHRIEHYSATGALVWSVETTDRHVDPDGACVVDEGYVYVPGPGGTGPAYYDRGTGDVVLTTGIPDNELRGLAVDPSGNVACSLFRGTGPGGASTPGAIGYAPAPATSSIGSEFSDATPAIDGGFADNVQSTSLGDFLFVEVTNHRRLAFVDATFTSYAGGVQDFGVPLSFEGIRLNSTEFASLPSRQAVADIAGAGGWNRATSVLGGFPLPPAVTWENSVEAGTATYNRLEGRLYFADQSTVWEADPGDGSTIRTVREYDPSQHHIAFVEAFPGRAAAFTASV